MKQLIGEAKSEGESPVNSEEESVKAERGYTSDSELTKSPRQTSARSQSPIVVPLTMSNSTNNTGGWILVS